MIGRTVIFSDNRKLAFFREGSILIGHLESLRAIAALVPENTAKQMVLKNLADIETLAITINKLLGNKVLLANPVTAVTLRGDLAALVEKWDAVDKSLSSSAMFAQAKEQIGPVIQILRDGKELEKTVSKALKADI